MAIYIFKEHMTLKVLIILLCSVKGEVGGYLSTSPPCSATFVKDQGIKLCDITIQMNYIIICFYVMNVMNLIHWS